MSTSVNGTANDSRTSTRPSALTEPSSVPMTVLAAQRGNKKTPSFVSTSAHARRASHDARQTTIAATRTALLILWSSRVVINNAENDNRVQLHASTTPESASKDTRTHTKRHFDKTKERDMAIEREHGDTNGKKRKHSTVNRERANRPKSSAF